MGCKVHELEHKNEMHMPVMQEVKALYKHLLISTIATAGIWFKAFYSSRERIWCKSTDFINMAA